MRERLKALVSLTTLLIEIGDLRFVKDICMRSLGIFLIELSIRLNLSKKYLKVAKDGEKISKLMALFYCICANITAFCLKTRNCRLIFEISLVLDLVIEQFSKYTMELGRKSKNYIETYEKFILPILDQINELEVIIFETFNQYPRVNILFKEQFEVEKKIKQKPMCNILFVLNKLKNEKKKEKNKKRMEEVFKNREVELKSNYAELMMLSPQISVVASSRRSSIQVGSEKKRIFSKQEYLNSAKTLKLEDINDKYLNGKKFKIKLGKAWSNSTATQTRAFSLPGSAQASQDQFVSKHNITSKKKIEAMERNNTDTSTKVQRDERKKEWLSIKNKTRQRLEKIMPERCNIILFIVFKVKEKSKARIKKRKSVISLDFGMKLTTFTYKKNDENFQIVSLYKLEKKIKHAKSSYCLPSQ